MAGSHEYISPEVEYVQSDDKTSLRKLAKKWGVPFGTIAARSKRRQWSKRREQYREKVNTAAEQKSVEGEAEDVSQVHISIRQSLKIAANHLQKGLVDQDFNLLKVAKISTETIQNLHGLLNDHYGQSGRDGIAPEEFARALDALTATSDSESPIPRPA